MREIDDRQRPLALKVKAGLQRIWAGLSALAEDGWEGSLANGDGAELCATNWAQFASDRHRWVTCTCNGMGNAMTGPPWVTSGLRSRKLVTGLDGSALIWDRFGGFGRVRASADSRQKPTRQAGRALRVVPANRF